MRATCFKITTARSPDAGAQRRNPGRYYFPALRFALCGLLADSALLSLDQRRRPPGARPAFFSPGGGGILSGGAGRFSARGARGGEKKRPFGGGGRGARGPETRGSINKPGLR